MTSGVRGWRADDTIMFLKTFSSLSAECQLQRLLRSQGKKISSSCWRMKTPTAFTRLGEEVPVLFTIRRSAWGKDPKLCACFPSCSTQRRDTDVARDSLYWRQMSATEQVYSVKLPRQHQLLMKSWAERGEEGYMFRHVFTIILQTSLFPKKNKMKAAYL